MQRTILFLFLSIVTLSALAQSKLDHALSEYGFHIDVDSTYWRRIIQNEVRKDARYNKEYDKYLEDQRFIARFYYIPKDSLNLPRTTFITIDVLPIEEGAGYNYVRADSSMSSNNFESFLSKISGGDIDRGFGKTFKDEYTGSMLLKFLTYVLVRKDGNTKFPEYVQLPRHFLIRQTKLVGDKIVAVEYHCYKDQQEDYFPRFEKIIRSFH